MNLSLGINEKKKNQISSLYVRKCGESGSLKINDGNKEKNGEK